MYGLTFLTVFVYALDAKTILVRCFVMKKMINPFDRVSDILTALPNGGVLLTSRAHGRVNTMTIGWGTLGIDWSMPVFIAYVREGRFTRELIDASGVFTVNVPVGEFDRRILGYAGTKSGRDVDKIAELGLTLEEPEVVSCPGIKQFPLTLECRVVCRQKQDISALAELPRNKYYPQDVPSTNPSSNRDAHIAYYGEIVCAYVIE